VSVLMTLSDLAAEHMYGGAHFCGVRHTPTARRRCSVLSNFVSSLLFLRTSFDAELPNLMWEGLFSGGQPYPNEGGSPALPNFWGSLLYAYTLCRRTIDAVTHMGSGLVFRRSIQPQTGGAPALPFFRIFCLWLHSEEERPN